MKNSLIAATLFISFLIVGLPFIGSVSAQEGVYSFDKRIAPNANGISVEFQETSDYVEAALRSKFEKLGKKKPKSMKKGLYMYEAVVMPEISTSTLNYYYRVEAAGSKSSTVSLFLSPGNNNFWSSEKFPEEMKRAEQMLYALEIEVATLKMQERIIAQKELIAKEEKQASNLQKEKEDMLKQIEKLKKEIIDTEASIEKNVEAQDTQAERLENERLKLAELIKELEMIIKR